MYYIWNTACSSPCPTTSMWLDYNPTLTVQYTNLQRKAGAQKDMSGHPVRLHSVHYCPKGDEWQVYTPNNPSLYWSTAYFSFHNNNAGGETSLLDLLEREWLEEEIGPVIILSSICPSCRVPPSLTHSHTGDTGYWILIKSQQNNS